MKRKRLIIVISIIAAITTILIRIPLKLLDVTLILVVSAVIIRCLFSLILDKSFRTVIQENMIVLVAIHLIILNTFKEIIYDHSVSGFFTDVIKNHFYNNTFVEPAIIMVLFAAISIIVFKAIYKRQYRLLAEYSLESLPGMQMNIESDLIENVITIDEAERLRSELHEKVDFTGAVDGLGSYQFYSLIFIGCLYFISLIYGLAALACDSTGGVSGWIAEFIHYMTFYSFIGVSVVMITATNTIIISYNIIHDNSQY
ncbi:MAG TPA: FHIPEP family type III secretion protein [Spirochaetota bacterium]|nr:FHIPEP family type III secretion protein [Spirochaetota bacterium]